MADRPLYLLFQLLREAPPYKMLGLIILMLLTALTEGIGIMMLIPMLGALSGSASGLTGPLGIFDLNGSIGAILSIFIALVTARAVLLYAQTMVGLHLQHGVVDNLRENCFGALIAAEWRWLAQQRTSDHASLLIINISRVGFALNQVLALFSTALAAMACLAAAFLLSWKVALMAVAGGFVFLFGFARHRRRALVLGHDLGAAHRAVHAHVLEGLAGVRLTKILGNETTALARFKSALANLRDELKRHAASTGRGRIATQAVGAVLMATLVYCGIQLWHIPMVQLLPALIVFARLVPMLESIQQAWNHWLHAVPALAETQFLLAEAENQAEPMGPQPSWELRDAITLENVCFTYGDQAKQALIDVSFTLQARTTTAIIGSSGAGKSSVADIVMGLIAPQSGKVIVDKRTLTGAERQSWRRSIAYVQQDVFLFHDTIRANMLIADYRANDDDLIRALTLASADFVLSLRDGLDTIVGDSGVRLSGGERQRIALARALLGKPQLLILDEATSALDPENETAIREAIAKLHGNLTVLIIGHRLAMLEHADQIIQLEAGYVLEVKTAAIPMAVNYITSD